MSKKYKKQGQKPLPTSTPILPELDEVSAQESVAVIQSVRIDYKRLGIGAMCALLFFLSLCFTAPSTIKVVYNRDSGGNFCNLFSLLAVLQSYNNPIFDTIRLGFDEWNLHTLRYVR